jgi:hypothetical protein
MKDRFRFQILTTAHRIALAEDRELAVVGEVAPIVAGILTSGMQVPLPSEPAPQHLKK